MLGFCLRAQAGLEYLLTYGWALVLIVSVASVLFFVFTPSGGNLNFSLSNNRQILFKSGNAGNLLLQNSSGGAIKVNEISFFGCIGAVSGFSLNGQSVFPVQVNSGGNISISGIAVENNCSGGGTVIFSYTDAFGAEKEARVNSNGGVGLPVAWYRFNEGSGATLKDSSGTNNGTLLPAAPNGPSWLSSGCLSVNCLRFDGLDDFVEVPHSAALNIGKEISLSAWVYPINFNGTYENAIITKAGDASWGVWNLHYKTPNKGFRFELNNGSIQSLFEAVPSTALNKWYHVAGVYNGAEMRFYVNGKLSNSLATSGSLAKNSEPLRIGKQFWWGSNYSFWDGRIAEIAVFDRALTAFEVCSACRERAVAASITCDC